MTETRKEKLRMAVRFFYDLQKLRIQTSNRATTDTVELEDRDQQFLVKSGSTLQQLEKDALKEVGYWLKGLPVYEQWLKQQKGCGVTMSGVILGEISMCRRLPEDVEKKVLDRSKDVNMSEVFKIEGFEYFTVAYIHKFELNDGTKKEVAKKALCFMRGMQVWEDCCPTISSLWSYCGLAVDTSTGKAKRRTKGEKSNWNPFVKTKMLGVLADCLIKANSPWRKYYDDYKHRWSTTGKGNSDGHRHNAAKRYMVKMFLAELYKEWRRFEGLPVRPPYSEEYGNKVHHTGPMMN